MAAKRWKRMHSGALTSALYGRTGRSRLGKVLYVTAKDLARPHAERRNIFKQFQW